MEQSVVPKGNGSVLINESAGVVAIPVGIRFHREAQQAGPPCRGDAAHEDFQFHISAAGAVRGPSSGMILTAAWLPPLILSPRFHPNPRRN